MSGAAIARVGAPRYRPVSTRELNSVEEEEEVLTAAQQREERALRLQVYHLLVLVIAALAAVGIGLLLFQSSATTDRVVYSVDHLLTVLGTSWLFAAETQANATLVVNKLSALLQVLETANAVDGYLQTLRDLNVVLLALNRTQIGRAHV